MVKENLLIYLVQREEIFQTVPYSVEEAQEKGKKNAMLTRKSPWKSFSTTHLPFLASNPKIRKTFPKTFPAEV